MSNWEGSSVGNNIFNLPELCPTDLFVQFFIPGSGSGGLPTGRTRSDDSFFGLLTVGDTRHISLGSAEYGWNKCASAAVSLMDGIKPQWRWPRWF